MSTRIPRYGVSHQTQSENVVEHAVEEIGLVGYTVMPGAYSPGRMSELSTAFDRALDRTYERYGRAFLERIDEHLTIRAPLAIDRTFLDLAMNPTVIEICSRLMGYVTLNQQNGIVNPPHMQRYNQGAFHRDLPYQHFVSTQPLAINALFCLDDFTSDNGATYVLPASHKTEAFPSDTAVSSLQAQVTAKAGSFIIMDCMLFHSGGINRTATARRAVNHVYSRPFLRQQIDLPALLGPDFTGSREIRQLLGYDTRSAQDIAAFYDARRAKIDDSKNP